MQKITPFLWFDKEAEDAAKFYTTLFKNASIGTVARYPGDTPGGPEGAVMTVAFTIDGTNFTAINAGPMFSTNPSVSFYVTCASEEEVDSYWKALSEGGKVLMELNTYPWSKKYGWIEDKFGVSWQLFVSDQPKPIRPCMMFANELFGKAEEAMNLYTSIFNN